MNIWMKNPALLQQAIETERRHANLTAAAQQGNALNSITVEENGIDVSAVPWPVGPGGSALEEYGFAHGKHTAQLAAHIATTVFNVVGEDLLVLGAASWLHDIGRKLGWRDSDPNHAERSAELADKVMKSTPSWLHKTERRLAVCKLIANHSLHKPLRDRSPLTISLYDADAYESARLAPDTKEGLSIMSLRMQSCVTEWALDANHQRKWRAQYWR